MRRPDTFDFSRLNHAVKTGAKIIGGTALLAVGSGQSAEVIAAGDYPQPDPAPIEVDPALPPPSHLITLSSRSGYDAPLKSKTKRLHEDATVALRWRYTTSQIWNQGCTAVKATVDQQVRYSSATHCFDKVTDDPYGYLPRLPGQPGAFDYGPRAAARNLVYGIFDPKVAPGKRQLLGTINHIVTSPGQDEVLLTAVAESTAAGVPRTLDKISAITLPARQREAQSRPRYGQIVSLSGVQQDNGERQISTLGRYIDRIHIYNDDGSLQRYEDLVGIKPKTIAEDTCMPGHSGSSFTSTTEDGRTYMSFALHGSINEIWGPALFNGHSDDPQPNDVTNELRSAKVRRAFYQARTPINLKTFTTLCIFAANLPNSVNTLNNGIGIPFPEPVHTGGEGNSG